MRDEGLKANDRFPTTRPSAILGARSDDAGVRAQALEVLTIAYWKPVYKYTRVRWRKSPEEAEDITQDFFTKVLDRDMFAAYDAGRARFRTFVRACLDRFIVDHEREASAKKRGGNVVRLQLDFRDAENEIGAGLPPAGDALDTYFDREWTRHVLGLAVGALRGELVAKGKNAHFAVFERYHLTGGDEPPAYLEIANELGMSVTEVTNRLSYARREFRRLVLETLRGITASEDEFRAEAQALLGVDA